MAVAQAVATSTEISFFGTCPTGWNNLNTAQKASCIGFNLKGRIGDYFGWAAAGELRDQWNKVGFKEYDAVIKCHRSRHRIYPPEIRLLSISSDQSSAYPFVIIICSREKAGKDTIARLELHPRLSRFGLRYLSRLSNTVMTMDKREGMASDSPLIMDRNMAGLATTPGHFSHFEIATPRVKHEQEPGYFPFTVDVGSSASGKGEDSRVISSSAKNLCGAKIAVYSGSASFRNPKRNSSTIGSVLKAGNRYFALTVAHVFFGDVDTNKSWFDSGLSLNSQLNHTSRDSSNPGHNEVRDPQISESYEIVIESLWPHHSDLQDGPGISRSAIGRVSPRITHQRRLPDAEVFPELLLDAQLDWALIELRDPSLWESNTLAASDGREVNLTLSNANISPPNDEVLIAAGTSGEVRGKCLGTVGGIMLPWSSSELHTWSVEAEIAVGDSGSLAIDPQHGLVHGLVVAYDPEVMMTHIVPITNIFQSILLKVGNKPSFVLGKPEMMDEQHDALKLSTDLGPYKGDDPNYTSEIERTSPIYSSFLSMLKKCAMHNAIGQVWINTRLLKKWMLEKAGQQATNLKLLIDFAYSEITNTSIDLDELTNSINDSLIVFSLLLEHKHGFLMHKFHDHGLNDSRLPFDKNILGELLIKSVSETHWDASLDSQILSTQWKYCPVIFDLDMALELPDGAVLPVVQRQRINDKGATAQLWEVSIPEDFVGSKLRQAASSARFSSVSDNLGPRYDFAVKAFSAHQRHLFQSERDAFRLLRDHVCFIRCFGDYTIHTEGKITHNILLEYAEFDLREYYATTTPPSTASDILAFWENMFRVVKAVSDLHSSGLNKAGAKQDLLGWHHDVKPDNILIVNGHFKLSDPGFARFTTPGQSPGSAFGGTVVYESPETHSLPAISIDIGQAMDVWALGCVFSEAAVWLVSGYSGLVRYNRSRKMALGSRNGVYLPDSAPTDEPLTSSAPCFHDGFDVLSEVRERHKDLLKEVRFADMITKKVLHVIDVDMLVFSPQGRASASKLHKMFCAILAEARAIPPNANDHWAVTRLTNPIFTGRGEILLELEAVIRNASIRYSQPQQCRIVISGMGGQGKSEICLQLAHRVRHLFWGVFWIDVSTASSAERSFLDLAPRLSPLAQTWCEVSQGIANLKHPWLLVLDNADDPTVDYQQYIPNGPLGVVILTSRNEECQQYATAKSITLGKLSDEEARELLLKAARTPPDQYHLLKEDAHKVAGLLQSHPLALIQAGWYVSRGHCTLAQYPGVYKRQRQRLLTIRPIQAQSRYQDVYATFEASVHCLKESGSEGARDALELLHILAACDRSRLPISLFEAGRKEAKRAPSRMDDDIEDKNVLMLTPWHVARLPSLMDVDADVWDSFRIVEAVQLLKAFALISTDTFNGSLSVSMHPLVHAWARDRQGLNKQHKSWLRTACLAAFSRGDRAFWRTHERQLQPHIEAITEWGIDTMFMAEPPLSVVSILVNCGWLLHQMRSDKKLFVLLGKILSYLGLELGHASKRWIGLYDLATRNLINHGKVKEAIPVMEQLVMFREQTLAEDQLDRLASQHVLAEAYLANGQVPEAVALLENVVGIRAQVLAEIHPARLASCRALASAYQANGQVKGAVALLEEVVEIEQHCLAEDHPERLASQHVLAEAYLANGRVMEAVALLENVVGIKAQVLAEDHPARLASCRALASAYQANGQVTGAIALLESVVEIEQHCLAEDHPERLASQHVLAEAYLANGRVMEAVALLENVVGIRAQVLAEDHPARLASCRALASAYQVNGQVTEAVALLEEVVKIEQHCLVEDHPERLASQHVLAEAYLANGQVKEAVALLENVMGIRAQVLAEDHPDRLATQHALAACLWELGSRQAALKIMKRVVEIRNQVLDKSHPSRQASEAWLEHYEEEMAQSASI